VRVPAGTHAFITTNAAASGVWYVSVSKLARTDLQVDALPRSYLSGCKLSNSVSDLTNNIDIAAGVCRDVTNSVNITVAAMTKILSSNWLATTNQGMRYSGAAIANTTYHVFTVMKADGTEDKYAYPDNGTDADGTAFAATVLAALQAETGGSTYLYLRRLGSIMRESAAIVAFQQDGDNFQRLGGTLSVNASNPGTSAVTRTLLLPLGLRLLAELRFYCAGTGGNPLLHLSDLATTDLVPSLSAYPLSLTEDDSGSIYTGVGTAFVRTNLSAQIRSRVLFSDASAQLKIAALGWRDTRGRDA
jgi:hypothetical protein